jgi:hypothetical protein
MIKTLGWIILGPLMLAWWIIVLAWDICIGTIWGLTIGLLLGDD